MLENIRLSIRRVTVIIALVAVVIAYVSKYLPWLTDGPRSQTMAEAFAERPDYFVGFPLMLIGGLLWIAVWFVLNHPKLTLLGILPLLLIWLVFLMNATYRGFMLGAGAILYIIALVVCVVMAFLTKKIKKGKKI